jgi:uncharacterized membrane protein SirB2
MSLLEIHPQLRTLHITCAYVSFALFVLRHTLNLYRVNWRGVRALKIMPHVIDSVLLLSAILLAVSLGQYPFGQSWLTVKVVALVAYILLGMQALNLNNTQGARRMAFFAAALVFGFIVTVARSRSPWGILERWL